MENVLMPGQKIGRLTLIEEAPRNKGRPYWRCICECGKECTVEAGHLKSGHTKSCGCRTGKRCVVLKPGMRFGSLTLTSEAPVKKGHRYWNCLCDCGRSCVVEASHLKSGHTKSCGCLVREMGRKTVIDLAGKRFGRLTAIEPSPSRSRGSVVWRCSCDCGHEAFCSADMLVQGKVRSCGCLQEEQRKKNMESAIHFVDGTCVERIAKQKEWATNTSGHRGVYRRENGKWRASMDFQKKRINLGTYDTFEEAVAARLEGEEIYHDFLAEYYAATK
ncbi:MAG: transcriptional regulator [Lachnospiraceae bacterium]|nr:transcriptional regulator [Lachnospiraceae bacterium]